MDSGQSKCTPNSTKESIPLDVKPLRSLTPMFPSSYGIGPHIFSVPSDSDGSFIYVSPSGPNFPSSHFPPHFPQFPKPQGTPTPQPTVNKSPSPYPFQTPPANVSAIDDSDKEMRSGRTSKSGRQIKKPVQFGSYPIGDYVTDGAGSSKTKPSKKRQWKKYGNDVALVPACQDPRESVEIVRMAYDALRRRLFQQHEGKEGKEGHQRPDLKAGTILMSNDLRANRSKRMGSVPGVEVGDIFYFRMELCLVGLHAPIMGGIDYMTSEFENGEDIVAISVVSAGGYENEEGDAEFLIYSGQGGNANIDQKLERGNLALERSFHRGIDIRVVRSAKDYSCPNGKIYIYDGLYKIQGSWIEKGKSGFNVFKYKLVRKSEQPKGIATWKKIQEWKGNPAGRDTVIVPDISSGIENLPVCLTNEVDNEMCLSHFTYVNKVRYLRPSSSMKLFEGCRCGTVCIPGDDNCFCAHANGGKLPYSSSGFLVSRRPVIYECNSSCRCSINCRNRVTQKGITVQFEVFKTRDRGWGLRSLDPIRAGTFICEYAGEVIETIQLGNEDAEEDAYIFHADGADDKAVQWNYGPELLGEPSADSSESFRPLHFSITAKNMGNVSRFMNHSCSPNVFWQPVLYDHGDEGYPHIMLFAMKNIPPMAELTYDYGPSGIIGFHRPKKCLCGSSKCRGLVG